MKKRILAMIFVLVLCFCTVIPAFAVDADGFVSEYERVQDMAKLLSESEREALIKTLDELSERQKMDVIVVTTNTLDGKKPMEYADDIYDYCKYGYGEKRDGLLFLVSMEDRDWWISTCGYGITAFTAAGLQYIGEQMVEDLGDGTYAAALVRHCGDMGYGPRRAREKLREKGVPQELWDEALDELPPDGEQIDRFLQSKLHGRSPEDKEKKRLTDALLRRGFSWGEVKSAWGRYGSEIWEE